MKDFNMKEYEQLKLLVRKIDKLDIPKPASLVIKTWSWNKLGFVHKVVTLKDGNITSVVVT